MNQKQPNRFRSVAGDDRIKLARTRTRKLVEHISSLFLMHEANSIVIYSRDLSAQIPRSYAAHAFNQFQRSMHLFEIVRLCAMWDSPGDDRESIPTIVELFNEPQLIEQIAREAHDFHANEAWPGASDDSSNPDDVTAAWWAEDRRSRAQQAERDVHQHLAFAAEQSATIEASPRLKALMDFRHASIAHNLTFPEPDMKTEATVVGVRYGDETALLEDTVAIADALHQGLNQTSFAWKGMQDIARRNASALWDNCTFNVPSRQPKS